MICGADGWAEVEEFGKTTEGRQRRSLELPRGMPTHDISWRVIAALTPAQFEHRDARGVGALADRLAGQRVTLDGKTLRRTPDRRAGRGPLQLVSAWAGGNWMVLAQQAVAAEDWTPLAAAPRHPGLAVFGGNT